MKTNCFTPTNLAHLIYNRVVSDEGSPYKSLVRKTDDIDIDYFEHIVRDSETLPPNLNMELKDTILHDFEQQAKQLFETSGLQKKLLKKVTDEAEAIKSEQGENSSKVFLSSLSQELRQCARNMVAYATLPNLSIADLEKKYEEARRITLDERILQTNKADVIDFFHVLMKRTVWECRELILHMTMDFLTHLAAIIDKDDNRLPEELLPLVEKMAENVHNVWAKGRILQGWKYGMKRDDDKKEHPLLIPYDKLPESEKEYDRNTSMETIRFILEQGFIIKKKGEMNY